MKIYFQSLLKRFAIIEQLDGLILTKPIAIDKFPSENILLKRLFLSVPLSNNKESCSKPKNINYSISIIST